jgi:small conductance mechanosensitive channel
MVAFFNQLIDGIVAGLPNILTALVIFIASLYLARIVSGLLRRALRRGNPPLNVTNLLVQLARWTIILAGTITALQRFFDVTAFLAGLGIIGFTVGFALQDVMKNFAAGIILLVQKPFSIGEVIGVNGFDGTVLEINLRTTEMKALDGRLVSMPNADVLSNPIINYTRAERRRVDLIVGVAYDSDTEVVRRVVLETIKNVPGFVKEPAPSVGFSTFGDMSMELNVNFWIDARMTNPAAAKDSAFSLIKNAFDDKEIGIPIAPRTLHLNMQKQQGSAETYSG